MLILRLIHVYGFPGGSYGKESAYNAGDLGSIPGWGRSPGEGNGYPLQCSGLENPMDRSDRHRTWGHKQSDTTERLTLSPHTCMYVYKALHTHFLSKWSYRMHFIPQLACHVTIYNWPFAWVYFAIYATLYYIFECTIIDLHIVVVCIFFFFTIKNTLKILQTNEASD